MMKEAAADLARAGVTAVHEPIALMAADGAIDLIAAAAILAAASEGQAASGLTAVDRHRLRAALPPCRPNVFLPHVHKGNLGGEVPLSEGGWFTCGDGAIEIYVPVELAETIARAAAGLRLNAVVNVTGLQDAGYEISSVTVERSGVTTGFTKFRCPVALLDLGRALEVAFLRA